MYKFSRWVPQDRSGKVCWLLNELNIPFEVQNLVYEKHHADPEYLEFHPLGYIPVLYDLKNNISLFESGAICLYLADQHPEKNLFPATLKAACYQWVMYNFSTLEPIVSSYWDLSEEDPELENKKSELDKKIAILLAPIEKVLSKENFICGNQFTVADIPLSQSLFWLEKRPVLNSFPKTSTYLASMKNREAAIRAELFTES